MLPCLTLAAGMVERYKRMVGAEHRLGVNIKNPETMQLIRTLASLTGETLTATVTEAVRQCLDGLRHAQQPALHDRLLAIGRDCAAHLAEPYRSADHGDLLYGDDGLSR